MQSDRNTGVDRADLRMQELGSPAEAHARAVDQTGPSRSRTAAAVGPDISGWGPEKLSAVEENASRVANAADGPRRAHAEAVLRAIADERRRRGEVAAHEFGQHVARVTGAVRGMGLEDRVMMAFREIGPEAWETEVLREIAASPGSSGTEIARAIGKRETGYINLAVGTLCSARELYLGPAPAAGGRDGGKRYSALLIDFTPRVEPDGSRSTGWTLKPAARAALRTLAIVA